MHVVLVNPEIAANTGNIIRLCANTGARLHLVEPLGFSMDSALLRRAGLDYHELADVRVHPTIGACVAALTVAGASAKYTLSSKSLQSYTSVDYGCDDVFVFGAERHGLSDDQTQHWQPATALHIPMRPGNRSLNLANAVAVVVYEAWRKVHFDGAAGRDERPASQTSEALAQEPFDR